MKNIDLFTERFKFGELWTHTEFLYNNNIWRKTNDTEAEKVNHPGASSLLDFMPNTTVYINHHDAPYEK